VLIRLGTTTGLGHRTPTGFRLDGEEADDLVGRADKVARYSTSETCRADFSYLMGGLTSFIICEPTWPSPSPHLIFIFCLTSDITHMRERERIGRRKEEKMGGGGYDGHTSLLSRAFEKSKGRIRRVNKSKHPSHCFTIKI
jgi:hypothetical protein